MPFVKGKSGNPAGRPPGSPSSITNLRNAIVQGATLAGGGSLVAYLEKQAKENPGPFMTLLGKVLPQKIEADITDRRTETLSDQELLQLVSALESESARSGEGVASAPANPRLVN